MATGQPVLLRARKYDATAGHICVLSSVVEQCSSVVVQCLIVH